MIQKNLSSFIVLFSLDPYNVHKYLRYWQISVSTNLSYLKQPDQMHKTELKLRKSSLQLL